MGLSCFKSWKHDSTGHKGNRDVLASPGSYFFLSNSAGQGDEWLKSLNKGVWIPFTGVFGQRLEETVLYERRYGVRLVPLVVEQCVTFIRERGLHEVGLFRQPGRASLVKELQEAFDSGERPTFDSSTDVHTVASLLKLYLRLLPEPLVPYKRYQDFLLCSQKLTNDRTVALGELRNLLHELPVVNFNLLDFICQFLNEVQSYSTSNKMSVQNLATVFGPNILRAKAEDPQSIMGGATLVQVLMLELIREHESLFAKIPPPVYGRPAGGVHASPGALKQPHLHPVPCLRQLSLPLIAERSRDPGPAAAEADTSSCVFSAAAKSDRSSGQKRHLGHRYTSSHPENCFYPLPSSSQSAQHHSDRHNVEYHQRHSGRGASPANVQASTSSLQLHEAVADRSQPGPAPSAWAEAWPSSGGAAAGFWRSSGAEGGGAGPETASGGSSEAQEDSTPSPYDNLHRQRMEGVTGGHHEAESKGSCEGDGEQEAVEDGRDSSSSWSSCEAGPSDECSDHVEEDDENKTGDHDDGDEGHENVHHPPSPASGSALSNSPLSTGSSEVFLPSGPPEAPRPDPQAQAQDPQSLLAELRQQMAQQRAQYQARIYRLERCNDVLERQVAVLRVCLEQQKRSQSVAEIKIRNMQRAKADADRRNSSLQRDMETFFQTHGDGRKRGGDEDGKGGASI
ncbi:rho GTPase-activating protein 22-like [Salarias fasciatus]|uniref:rho GTPase-activating protein 22-like n=1 Tax=Salarias fasciatus TaxID=181472 RepID=UPI0011768403|nr:rho GTPase-activating protein 22-like [Salarias fasciatus]